MPHHYVELTAHGVLDESQLPPLDSPEPIFAVHRETGADSIAARVLPPFGLPWQWIYIRCHFVGGTATATLAVVLESVAGDAYNTLLHTTGAVGTGTDLNLILSDCEGNRVWPSSWAFGPRDALRLAWTNPDVGNMVYGLEVGCVVWPVPLAPVVSESVGPEFPPAFGDSA